MGRAATDKDLEALYRQRFADFLRIAMAITGDESLAHDAVQEGFGRALRSLRTFRSDAPLEAWVWRIVINAARDARPAEQLVYVADTPEQAEPARNGSTSDFAGWLMSLPERQRLAVFLRYAADLDYGGISVALGAEVGTVSATLHAAHQRLRRLIEEVPSDRR
jgi:RNA polymerase sigma-70 factor (ECF subfamily)